MILLDQIFALPYLFYILIIIGSQENKIHERGRGSESSASAQALVYDIEVKFTLVVTIL